MHIVRSQKNIFLSTASHSVIQQRFCAFMDATGCTCARVQRVGKRGRVSVCVFASVSACVAICQHMFDRWQKKRASLIALIQEDAQEARWGK